MLEKLKQFGKNHLFLSSIIILLLLRIGFIFIGKEGLFFLMGIVPLISPGLIIFLICKIIYDKKKARKFFLESVNGKAKQLEEELNSAPAESDNGTEEQKKEILHKRETLEALKSIMAEGDMAAFNKNYREIFNKIAEEQINAALGTDIAALRQLFAEAGQAPDNPDNDNQEFNIEAENIRIGKVIEEIQREAGRRAFEVRRMRRTVELVNNYKKRRNIKILFMLLWGAAGLILGFYSVVGGIGGHGPVGPFYYANKILSVIQLVFFY